MSKIDIPIVAGAEVNASDELRHQIERLEADGRRIVDIRYAGWAANHLGIIPDPQTHNAGTYRVTHARNT